MIEVQTYNGKPDTRAHYGPSYFAVFALDLVENKTEALPTAAV